MEVRYENIQHQIFYMGHYFPYPSAVVCIWQHKSRLVAMAAFHWYFCKVFIRWPFKFENERQERIEKNYQGVSQKLFGKYVIIKTNLPWIITGSFFVITLFIRFVFDVIIPVWIAVFFVIVLTISVFYSIGIERKIAEYIDKESNSTNQTRI